MHKKTYTFQWNIQIIWEKLKTILISLSKRLIIIHFDLIEKIILNEKNIFSLLIIFWLLISQIPRFDQQSGQRASDLYLNKKFFATKICTTFFFLLSLKSSVNIFTNTKLFKVPSHCTIERLIFSFNYYYLWVTSYLKMGLKRKIQNKETLKTKKKQIMNQKNR